MSRHRQSSVESFSGINITPLMDLTFLLLIVFMIAAPMLEYTVNVSPPKMNADQPDPEENVLISLDADGKIILDHTVCSLSDLAARLEAICQSRPEVPVFIRAHQERPYREVIDVMRTAKAAGMTNLSLVTQAEE